MPGWWMGTHLSHKSKTGIIRAAAEVFQLEPGDFRIQLRNR